MNLRLPFSFLCAFFLTLLVPARAETVLFTLDFAAPAIRASIEKAGGVIVDEGPDGTPAARFTVTPEELAQKKSRMVHFKLPVEILQGTRIQMTSRVRGENLLGLKPTDPLPGYFGGKIQLYVNTPTSGKRWLDARGLHGTFTWRDAGLMCGILNDASDTQVRVGIEGASGTFWVHELKLVLLQPKLDRTVSATARDNPAVTQMRGFMSPHKYRDADFDDLAALNVNAVRWQMFKQVSDKRPYSEWIAEELDDLALALDGAAARGIKLAVDLHTVPGDRLPDRTHRMYLEKQYHDEFIALWQTIARRFKGHPGLWAYDLVNEPVQNFPSPAGLPDWLGIQVAAGKAIRAIDADTPIMIEVDQWDSPDSFTWLQPVDLTNVIYQAHMYWPGEFSHQGVRTNQGIADGKEFERSKFPYPGTIHGLPFNKETLRRYLAPVRAFQLAHNAHIFLGEFSAVRWAPGAAGYLDDLISIYEEYGWDWTYHAFRESPVWSVEHENLPYDLKNHPVATSPTDRMLVLQKYLAKNPRRPGPLPIYKGPAVTPAPAATVTPKTPAPVPAPSATSLLPIRKIHVVGNSITFHAPYDKLNWTGRLGMAASSEAADYPHRLANLIAARQGNAPELIINATGGGSMSARLANPQSLTSVKADVIILQMGENDNKVDLVEFQKLYEQLVVLLRTANPDARIVCTGVWRPKPGKDDAIREVCRRHRVLFADISKVSANAANRASTETHPGVAWHPNDAGMEGYAQAIWSALQAGEAAIP
jgi:endoglucanase